MSGLERFRRECSRLMANIGKGTTDNGMGWELSQKVKSKTLGMKNKGGNRGDGNAPQTLRRLRCAVIFPSPS